MALGIACNARRIALTFTVELTVVGYTLFGGSGVNVVFIYVAKIYCLKGFYNLYRIQVYP